MYATQSEGEGGPKRAAIEVALNTTQADASAKVQ